MPQFTDQAVDLAPEVIAEAVCYALAQPENVDVSDLVVRPSRERCTPGPRRPGRWEETMFTVCHMFVSLDGKIDGDFLPPQSRPCPGGLRGPSGGLPRQAILYGTTTMLGGFADGPAPACPGRRPLAKEDSVNPQGQRMGQFVVSVDPKGVFGLSGPVLERKGRPAAHVIQAVTEQVDPAYLTYLRQVGVSYLFAGKEQLDCPLLLEKLAARFGVQRLMVAGGGVVNWSFLQAGCVDEVSLVVAPWRTGPPPPCPALSGGGFLPNRGPVALLAEAKPLAGGRVVGAIHRPGKGEDGAMRGGAHDRGRIPSGPPSRLPSCAGALRLRDGGASPGRGRKPRHREAIQPAPKTGP